MVGSFSDNKVGFYTLSVALALFGIVALVRILDKIATDCVTTRLEPIKF